MGIHNPFKHISSSQGRASGGAISAGARSTFNKNQTIEVEKNRRRTHSRGETSLINSESPDRQSSKPRARSGGSSQNRRVNILGVSASFSPRSRVTTNFAEARSVLMENQSSGLSINSKKKNKELLKAKSKGIV